MIALSINGTDARTLGFVLSAAPGWADLPARSWPSVALPGHQGVRRLTDLAVDGPRTLRLAGVLSGTDAADLLSKLDALKLLLAGDTARLRFGDRPTRYLDVLVQTCAPLAAGAHLNSRQLALELTALAEDGLFYDDDAQDITVDDTNTGLPQGTGVTRPVLTITGATDPTLVAVETDGATGIGSMALTGVTSGQTVVVDLDALTITIDGANGMNHLTDGEVFEFDPALVGQLPTLSCSSGSCAVAYRKAWR